MRQGRQGARQREERQRERWWREEAERDKVGTSQIGNISFQHVLSEHFICEKRHGGRGGPSSSKTQLSSVMKQWTIPPQPKSLSRLLKNGSVAQNSLSNTCNTANKVLGQGVILSQGHSVLDITPFWSKTGESMGHNNTSIFIWAQADGTPAYPVFSVLDISLWSIFTLKKSLESINEKKTLFHKINSKIKISHVFVQLQCKFWANFENVAQKMKKRKEMQIRHLYTYWFKANKPGYAKSNFTRCWCSAWR